MSVNNKQIILKFLLQSYDADEEYAHKVKDNLDLKEIEKKDDYYIIPDDKDSPDSPIPIQIPPRELLLYKNNVVAFRIWNQDKTLTEDMLYINQALEKITPDEYAHLIKLVDKLNLKHELFNK